MAQYYSGSSSKYHQVIFSLVHPETRLDRAVHPSDFSYKHKADRTVNLVLTPLAGLADESVPGELWAALDPSPPGTYSQTMPLVYEFSMWILEKLPIALLFSTFLYLRNPERLKKMLGQVLGLLMSGVDKEPTVLDLSLPSDPFQSHLEALLYGDRELNKLRMKLCVADFCWVCSILSGVGVSY